MVLSAFAVILAIKKTCGDKFGVLVQSVSPVLETIRRQGLSSIRIHVQQPKISSHSSTIYKGLMFVNDGVCMLLRLKLLSLGLHDAETLSVMPALCAILNIYY